MTRSLLLALRDAILSAVPCWLRGCHSWRLVASFPPRVATEAPLLLSTYDLHRVGYEGETYKCERCPAKAFGHRHPTPSLLRQARREAR